MRRHVIFRRAFHAQRFMRSFFIVFPQPARAAPLLAHQPQRRTAHHFGFVNPMELFMRTVLAGPARRDEFHFDSQFEPPGA